MRYMVFDIGGTAVKYSSMDEHLNVFASGEVSTPRDAADELVALISDIVRVVCPDAAGIAMSLPGIIDSDTGFCYTGGALQYNYGCPLGDRISQACNLTVKLENDGKCAAMAELRAGALKGCENAAVLVLGTGVGGGLILGGKVHRGIHRFAGEFSFINTNPDCWSDVMFKIGNRCSTRGLLALCRTAKGLPDDDPLDGRQAFAQMAAGDEQMLEALHSYCRVLGTQIYNMAVLLDLERVALGGGISNQDLLIDGVRFALKELHGELPPAVQKSPVRPPEIVRCAFGSEANQVGALYNLIG